jgi:DNA primase
MDFVEQLKSSVDIVHVIQEYVPRLRKVGSSRYTGLCPFHNEKTPSFSVHAGHQYYKCFGCGAGGDVLKFVMEMETISFYEALKLLAERYGIPMPKRSEYSDPETKLRAALHQMHEMAEEAFRANLEGAIGAEARSYLDRRGVAPAISAEFGLGYAERSGRSLVRLFEKHNFTAEQMEASGLLLKRDDGSFYDRFRHRLMFPIHNEMGKIIGFGGRALDPNEQAKYLNSPDTPAGLYHKSYVLYNLHRAKHGIRQSDRVVLVEGYMDVIGVYASGVREVVASCGTALTSHQVQAMKRHSEKIVVNFDPDAAGAQGAERSINMLLDEGMHVRVLELDGGLDPDEYCKQRGAEAYAAKLNAAKNYFYWLADRARGKFDMRSAEGRVAGFQFLLPAIQRLSDKLERLAVVNDVAGYLGVDPGPVLENFRKAAAERREKTVRPAAQPVRPVERILLNLLLVNADARSHLLPRLKRMPALTQFSTRRIFEALFTLDEAGNPLVFGDLDARLEDSDRALLASAVLADETDSEVFSLEQGEACLQTMESSHHDTERAAIKAQVRAAERDGNFAEALRLSAELSRIDKG